jgi:hypothetical protein
MNGVLRGQATSFRDIKILISEAVRTRIHNNQVATSLEGIQCEHNNHDPRLITVSGHHG